MHRFLLFMICLLSLLSSASAQINTGCKIGYIYQQSSYLECGMLIYKRQEPHLYHLNMYGLNIGSEFRTGGSKFIASPGISAEAHYYLFGARLGANYFTDFKQGALAFSPELGISIFGFYYLMSGYNWTISNRDFWNVTGFRLSLGANLGGWKRAMGK